MRKGVRKGAAKIMKTNCIYFLNYKIIYISNLLKAGQIHDVNIFCKNVR